MTVPIAIFVMIAVGWRSDLLRDSGNYPARPGVPSQNTFSLARVQMAFWTFVIVSAYAFVWSVTGRLDTLNKGVLALLGVAGATMLGAVAIGAGKRAEIAVRLQQITTELAAATAALSAAQSALANRKTVMPAPAAHELDALNAAVATAQAQFERLAQEHNLAHTAVRLKTDWFLPDILTDANGISFHRFQLVIWTLVLGAIFIHSTYQGLILQEFDPTLLGLMGITSGLYLGFKFPEK
jgi:hypothetical protein